MRIGIVSPEFPPEKGGIQTYAFEFTQELARRGYEVTVLHLLTPDELDPPLAGDLRLIDCETGAPQDVTLDGSLRDLYRKRVRAWQKEIEAFCLKRGLHYVPVTTDLAWDELVLYQLRQRGLVK